MDTGLSMYKVGSVPHRKEAPIQNSCVKEA